MNLMALSTLSLSDEHGWTEVSSLDTVRQTHLTARLMMLAAVPPAMLYFAGTRRADMFPADISAKSWGETAVAFLLAEVLTVLAMGWLIRQTSASHGLVISPERARMLACLSAVPMWLSGAGLLTGNLASSAVIALVGLGLACGTVYHGIRALCATREDVTAAGIVQVVIGAGVIAWASLLTLALA